MKKSLLSMGVFLSSLTLVNAQLNTDSLVANYPFDGNANDISGKGNNGTVNNATLATGFDGKPNSAYYFNGTNANIDLGNDPSISRYQTDFTVMAWVKRESSSMTTNTILSNRSNVSSGNSGSQVYIANGTNTSYLGLTVSGGSTATTVLHTNVFSGLNEWHHYAVTYRYKGTGNINPVRLYIDGVLVKEDSTTSREVLNPGTTKSYLGMDLTPVLGITRFKGAMDEVMIFKRALGSPEIANYVGIKRNALNFDGSNDFISLGNTLNEVFAGAGKKFTLEAWIRPESHAIASENAKLIMSKYGNSACSQNARQFSLSLATDGKLNFVTYGATNSTIYRVFHGSTVMSLNTWNHIAVTYDGSVTSSNPLDRVKMYVNGVLEATIITQQGGAYPYNIPTSTAHFGIGAALSTAGAICSQPTQRFDGSMDEIRIWDTVRTCTDIVSNKDCKLSGMEEGLVVYYDFDQGNADTTNTGTNVLIDIAGADQNGTLNNFALTGKTSNWINGESNGVSSTVCNKVIPSNCTPVITSFEDINLGEVDFLYPNPTTDKLYLNKKSLSGNYVIFNSLGVEIEKGAVSENGIDVSGLDSGLYHLQLSENGLSSRSKFVKQ